MLIKKNFQKVFFALIPRQPYHRPGGKKWLPYGSAGVCLGIEEEARQRTLFNRNHPVLKDFDPNAIYTAPLITSLAGKLTSVGVTSLEVFNALNQNNTQGYVYAVDVNLEDIQEVIYEDPEAAANDPYEHRAINPVIPCAYAKVGVKDMPERIIFAQNRSTLNELATQVNGHHFENIPDIVDFANKRGFRGTNLLSDLLNAS